ncbi:MAG: thioesterase family protein [Bacteroidia bacterium]
MPKISISTPEKFHHSFQIQVRVTDLNYGNHLANDKIQSYLQEARIDFLTQKGLSELNVGANTSLIQGDAAIVFKSEGFLHDKILVKIAIDDISNSSFDFVYELTNLTTGKLLAIAKTRMVCFNYDVRKVRPVTQELLSLTNDQ